MEHRVAEQARVGVLVQVEQLQVRVLQPVVEELTRLEEVHWYRLRGEFSRLQGPQGLLQSGLQLHLRVHLHVFFGRLERDMARGAARCEIARVAALARRAVVVVVEGAVYGLGAHGAREARRVHPAALVHRDARPWLKRLVAGGAALGVALDVAFLAAVADADAGRRHAAAAGERGAAEGAGVALEV